MNVKSRIIELLTQNRGADLSGEEMARRLGVSRSAVWKAITSLREDGYEILSSTNRGYRLCDGCDILSAEGTGALMRRPLPVYVQKTVDSTNSFAKRAIASAGCKSAVFAAESQTGGRGRQGRAFYSPPGSVYMSYVFSPNAPLESTLHVTAAAAVAVVRVIDRFFNVRPMIKWVNDVYVGGKKVCGILTEAVSDFETKTVSHVIIGIGINLAAGGIPRELENTAIALPQNGITRNEITAALSDELYSLTRDLSDRSFFAEYRARMLWINEKIAYIENGIKHPATLLGVEPDGGLAVMGEDGVKKILRSGEISLRKENDDD